VKEGTMRGGGFASLEGKAGDIKASYRKSLRNTTRQISAGELPRAICAGSKLLPQLTVGAVFLELPFHSVNFDSRRAHQVLCVSIVGVNCRSAGAAGMAELPCHALLTAGELTAQLLRNKPALGLFWSREAHRYPDYLTARHRCTPDIVESRYCETIFCRMTGAPAKSSRMRSS